MAASNRVRDDESHTAVASGYLFKLARNGTPLARWHRRYYVLFSDGLLLSYKSVRSRSPQRTIQVGRKCLRTKFGAETSKDDCKHWPKRIPQSLRFCVVNSDRTFHFVCESERELGLWRENLLLTLGRLAPSSSEWAANEGGSDTERVLDDHQIEPGEVLTTDLVGEGEGERNRDDEEEEEEEEETGVMVEGSGVDTEEQTESRAPSNDVLPTLLADTTTKVSTGKGDEGEQWIDPEVWKFIKDEEVEEEEEEEEVEVMEVKGEVGVMDEALGPGSWEVGRMVESSFSDMTVPVPAQDVSMVTASVKSDRGQQESQKNTAEVTFRSTPSSSHAWPQKVLKPAAAQGTHTESPVARGNKTLGLGIRERMKIFSGPNSPPLPSQDYLPTNFEPKKNPVTVEIEISMATSPPASSSSPPGQSYVPTTFEPKKKQPIRDPEVSMTTSSSIASPGQSYIPVTFKPKTTSNFLHTNSTATTISTNQKPTMHVVTSPPDLLPVLETPVAVEHAAPDRVQTAEPLPSPPPSPPPAEPLPSPPPSPPPVVKVCKESPAATVEEERGNTLVSSQCPPLVFVEDHDEEEETLSPLQSPVAHAQSNESRLSVRQRMKRFSEPAVPLMRGSAKSEPIASQPLPTALSARRMKRQPFSLPANMSEMAEEKGRDRVAAAVEWVDKELRKLIEVIVSLGWQDEQGQTVVEFGVLFEETANIFEALSGILKTAKKHKVVTFPGELLFQGIHDKVLITLLKLEVEDSSLDKYTTAIPKGMRRTDIDVTKRKKTSGFGTPTQIHDNVKCFVCGKRVYALEFVAANQYVFHKWCFRCQKCSKILNPSSYATIEDTFYCIPHYEQLYMQGGGYGSLSQ